MNTIKKMMFMSSDKKNDGMGILKLENKNGNIFCNLKTYYANLDGEYILGIKLKDKIIKQNIKIENNSYNFVLSEHSDLNHIMSCVLMKIIDDNIFPIIWCTNKNENYKNLIISTLRNNLFKQTTSQINNTVTTNTTSNNNDKHLTKEDTHPINTISDPYNEEPNKNLPQDKISCNTNTTATNQDLLKCLSKLQTINNTSKENNVYHPINYSDKYNLTKNLFDNYNQELYTQEKNNNEEIAIASNAEMLFDSSDEEIENTIDLEINKEENIQNFYNMIADQIEDLFEKYPKEENLMKLIENSYWVKIDTDIDNKHYVVGIIKQNEAIKYICYGVPGSYNNEPTDELKQYSQWLPTDVSDPYNNGYWVMYQDANTGENIYIN